MASGHVARLATVSVRHARWPARGPEAAGGCGSQRHAGEGPGVHARQQSMGGGRTMGDRPPAPRARRRGRGPPALPEKLRCVKGWRLLGSFTACFSPAPAGQCTGTCTRCRCRAGGILQKERATCARAINLVPGWQRGAAKEWLSRNGSSTICVGAPHTGMLARNAAGRGPPQTADNTHKTACDVTASNMSPNHSATRHKISENG